MRIFIFLILIVLTLVTTTMIFYYNPSSQGSINQAFIMTLEWYGKLLGKLTKAVIHDLFGKDEVPATTYPVLIGYNDITNHFNTDIIDKTFREMEKSFSSCYCETPQKTESLITYPFKIQLSNSAYDDMPSYKELIQNQAESSLKRHMQQYGCDYLAEPLTATQLVESQNTLYVFFARNQKGIEEIQKIKQVQYRQEHEPKPEIQILKESWNSTLTDTQSEKMNWGYRRDNYYNNGIPMRIPLNIKTHCHALITGSSGSGKSQALLFLIGMLIQSKPDICIYVCDFKNSEDFRFLRPYSHYYAGNDCYEGVMEYYSQFSMIRESDEIDKQRYVLIFDEYPSFINYLQMKDKQNKTRFANDILSAVSEILMLGRGTGGGFGCWIVTQRSDSSLFANGARDNFMVCISLGNLSKEQRNMIFSNMEIPDRIFTAGEGILLADGKGLAEVKYPLIEDVSDWQEHILSALMRHGGACADV